MDKYLIRKRKIEDVADGGVAGGNDKVNITEEIQPSILLKENRSEQQHSSSFVDSCAYSTTTSMSSYFSDEDPMQSDCVGEGTVKTTCHTFMSPNQPLTVPDDFPVQILKGRSLKFLPSWFKSFEWLHIDPNNSSGVLCFYCMHFLQSNPDKILSKKMEDTFAVRGFSNWKKSLEKFRKHANSDAHKQAILSYKQKKNPIDNQIYSQINSDQGVARVCLEKIMTTIRFLAKQGLALRGHESESGNFFQLLSLRGEDVPELSAWIKRRRENFLDGKIQNEVLEIMGKDIVRKICVDIRSQNPPIFAVICDGTRDVTGEEQLSICFRWVDMELCPHESFVGLYNVKKTTGEHISSVIFDVMTRLQLPVANLRGQTYDGAGNMSGSEKGVQSIICERQPLASFVHCGAHCGNLVMKDACEASQVVRNSLQWAHELGVLFSRSLPARSRFIALIEQYSSGPVKNFSNIKPLCPTRWIYRLNQIEEIIGKYQEILVVLEEIIEGEKNNKSSSTAAGLLKLFEAGTTLLGLIMARDVVRKLEFLNRSIQGPKQNTSGLIAAVELVHSSIFECRTEEGFHLLFEESSKLSSDMDLLPISLPRMRATPKRFSGKGDNYRTDSAESYYRKEYFMMIDSALSGLKTRFSQGGLQRVQLMEGILLGIGDEEKRKKGLDLLRNFPELDTQSLVVELEMFKLKYLSSTISTVGNFAEFLMAFKELSPEVKRMFLNIDILLRLILVLPSTSCESERSFSALRRLKTYLRNSMTQQRLNHVALCHTHQDLLENMEVANFMKTFISANERRLKVFGMVAS